MDEMLTQSDWLAFSAILFAGLSALAVIDARTYRLPDLLTLPLIVIGLIASYMLERSLLLSAIGAVIGYGLFFAIEKLYLQWRGRAGLGRGDAKLLAAGGAWCGALALAPVVLIASSSALLVVLVYRLSGKSVTRETALPFGPFLSLGISLVWVLQAVLPDFMML